MNIRSRVVRTLIVLCAAACSLHAVSSRTLAEPGFCPQPTWVRSTMVPRTGHAMCYDSARQRLVLFGGRAVPDDGFTPVGDLLGDTWEFDGAAWHKVAEFAGQPGFGADATTGPDPRDGHAMAYDPIRQRTVMWGGSAGDAGLVWEWNGTAWTPITPEVGTQQPFGRAGHAMTFDFVQRKVVMLGSEAGANDHWTWDGTRWQFRSNLPNVCCFDAHGIGVVSDPNRGRLVITGGSMGPNTYEWDGIRWNLRANNSPGGAVSMAYDRLNHRTLLRSSNSANVWVWNGAAWTVRTQYPVEQGGGSPAPVASRPVSAYSGYFGRELLMVDGAGARQCDTFAANYVVGEGSTYWQLLTLAGPGPRFDHSFSPASGPSQLLFGGLEVGVDGTLRYAGDAWALIDGAWYEALPQNYPGRRYDHATCFDSLRFQAILHGGAVEDFGDFGFIDSNTFVIRPFIGVEVHGDPSVAPTRTGHSIAYDASRDRVVLFGGWSPETGYTNDTWEFDPSRIPPFAWTQVHSGGPAAPPGREQFGMAYDASRGRTVLFGGFNTDGTLNDTWEWDGSTWRQITPAFATNGVFGQPSPRAYHAMAYDTVRQRVVLYGGEDTFFTQSDLWEWDGTSWFVRAFGGPGFGLNPGPRSSHALSFDTARGRLMLSAGISPDPFDPFSGSFIVHADVLESASTPIVPPTDLGPQTVNIDQFGFAFLSAYEFPSGFQARWLKDGVPIDDGPTRNGTQGFQLFLYGVGADDAGTYRLATADPCGSYLSGPITVMVNTLTPPFFTQQPMNQTVSQGETATFIAGAAGVPTPNLQWFRGEPPFPLSNDGHYDGVYTNTLSIANVSPADEDVYRLVAFNSAGQAASEAAHLMVFVAPFITAQTSPTQLTKRFGQTAVFTADATGTPFPSLQWHRNGQPLSDDGRIVGAFTGTLTINNLAAVDFGVYQLVATNAAGTATSDPGVLIVSAALCALDYNEDGSLNSDDIGDFITDYFTEPPISGPGGYAVMCPANEMPYCDGYKAAYTLDESGQCYQPNSDNLGDYITNYFNAVGCDQPPN